MSCPLCGNDEAVLLGTLGNREHVTCRACGAEYSHEIAVEADYTLPPDGFETRGVLAGQYPRGIPTVTFLIHYDRGDLRALCRASLTLNDDNMAPGYGAPVTCTRCAQRARRFPDGIVRNAHGRPLYRKDR